MSTEANQLSTTAGFKMSLTQARQLWEPTELQAVGAFLLRNCFTPLYTSGGVVCSGSLNPNPAPFAVTTYQTITIAVSWASGRSASLSATIDPLYGDMSGTVTDPTGTTTTTNQSLNGIGLVNNCQVGQGLGILKIQPHSGDTDPTTTPTSIVIAAGGLSATCTWGSPVPNCTLTITLTVAQTLDQDVEAATGLLQYVTLADSYAAPAKTYSCTCSNSSSGRVTQTTRLRFPSEFAATTGATNNGRNWLGVTNSILIMPLRGATNGVAFWSFPFLGSTWTWDIPLTNSYQFGYPVRFGFVPPPPAYFARCIFAYGMSGSTTENVPYTIGIQQVNSVLSVKSAIKAKQKVLSGTSSGVQVSATTGLHSTVSFALSPAILNNGLYIIDPVPLMTSPPAGYTVDPTGGTFTVLTQTPFANGGPYGGIVWNYV